MGRARARVDVDHLSGRGRCERSSRVKGKGESLRFQGARSVVLMELALPQTRRTNLHTNIASNATMAAYYASSVTDAERVLALDHGRGLHRGRCRGWRLRARGGPAESLLRGRCPGGRGADAGVVASDQDGFFEHKVYTLGVNDSRGVRGRSARGKIDFAIVEHFCWSSERSSLFYPVGRLRREGSKGILRAWFRAPSAHAAEAL